MKAELHRQNGGRVASSPLSTEHSTLPHCPFRPAPEFETLLEQIKIIGNDLDTLSRETLAAVRAVREERAGHFLWEIPVQAVRDFVVPGAYHEVPVRLYVPQDKQLAREGKLPLVVFFHGGGWTLGSYVFYDSVTRLLARQIPALVLSANYRLAPENPFPAAVQDADAVLAWVRHYAEEVGGDTGRVIVAGDSGGGTLATVAARHARAEGGPPIAMQILFYPSTNIFSTDYESYRQYGTDHLLTQRAIEAFRDFYLPNRADWTNPDASPLLAKDLGGLPSTLIIAAGCDPLRDEAEAYARKLREQGVEVTYRLEPDLLHAFLSFYNIISDCSPYAEAVLGYTAGVIRRRL